MELIKLLSHPCPELWQVHTHYGIHIDLTFKTNDRLAYGFSVGNNILHRNALAWLNEREGDKKSIKPTYNHNNDAVDDERDLGRLVL